MGKGGWSEPLTAVQLENATRVKDAYLDFWRNLKFRKGWDAPLFAAEEVDDLLSHAAEIVVRVRTWLDDAHPGFCMRVVGGSSQEFLWDLDYHPRERPDAFLRGLVHATFKDAKGYVEGLSEAQLDDFMTQILKSEKKGLATLDTAQEVENLYIAEDIVRCNH